MVRQVKRDKPVEVEDALAERIYQKTGGHPYLLQILCSHLYEDEHLNEVTDEVFDVVYRECNHANIFNEAYELLRPLERKLFLRLPIHKVELHRLAAEWKTNEEKLQLALKELVLLGYAKIQEGGTFYLPADDFWSKWIRDSELSSLRVDAIKNTPTQDKSEEDRSRSRRNIISITTIFIGVSAILSSLLDWNSMLFVVPSMISILFIILLFLFLRRT